MNKIIVSFFSADIREIYLKPYNEILLKEAELKKQKDSYKEQKALNEERRQYFSQYQNFILDLETAFYDYPIKELNSLIDKSSDTKYAKEDLESCKEFLPIFAIMMKNVMEQNKEGTMLLEEAIKEMVMATQFERQDKEAFDLHISTYKKETADFSLLSFLLYADDFIRGWHSGLPKKREKLPSLNIFNKEMVEYEKKAKNTYENLTFLLVCF